MISRSRSRLDEKLGMLYYSTSSSPINGRIRTFTEDFIVEEILRDKTVVPVNVNSRISLPLCDVVKGNYVRAILIKKGYDTLSAIFYLSKKFKLPISAFSYLGLKDARALSSQLISIKIDYPISYYGERILLTNSKQSLLPVKAHELYGNKFTITIRSISLKSEDAVRRVQRIFSELSSFGGVLAYFGYQRFGTLNPITHKIGKAIVKRNIDLAVSYLINSNIGEKDPIKTGLRPRKNEVLDYERIVRRFFTKKSNALKAIKKVPLPIRRLFIHAYQSYLFNRILSERIKLGLPINRAVIGDLVGLPIFGSVSPQYVFHVDKNNLDKVNSLIKRNLISVVLPVPGYAIKKLPIGLAKEPIQGVLDDEGISFNDFLIDMLPNLRSPGTYRPVIFQVENFKIMSLLRNESSLSIKIQFSLRRGFYATMFLRELIKPFDPALLGF